jgi:hypothetical protein
LILSPKGGLGEKMEEMNPEKLLSARRRRVRLQAQSLTVAIIVLFLLLFLGGLFIALIVNNMRSVKSSANRSAADKFAEAGVKYLDEQLTVSPEGADWRPVPYVVDADDFTVDSEGKRHYVVTDVDGDGNTNTYELVGRDPDYAWLQPCSSAAPGEACGYSRVSFGGPTPGKGNAGGRALVRITYQPNATDPASKYLKLEAIGRSGFINFEQNPIDPTTFANSEAKGLRRELTAYKTIGLVEYLLHMTNKDGRPSTATIGAINNTLDAPFQSETQRPDPVADSAAARPVQREIPSVFYGPIHSNAPLAFYGANWIFLNAQRGDTLTTAATFSLNGVADTAATLRYDVTAPTDPTRSDPTHVFVAAVGSAPLTTPNLFPSGSGAFNTLGNLVRDNNSDLRLGGTMRSVAKTTAPLLDTPVGGKDLTRYRMLTRNSVVMDGRFSGPANNTNLNTLVNTNSPDYPGRIGWGAGLYINNPEDIQRASDLLSSGYSPRADWLGTARNTPNSGWLDESRYVPPATVLELTPRFFKMTRSSSKATRLPLTVRTPSGQRITQTAMIRWSGRGNGTADTPPSIGLPAGIASYEGYPAVPVAGSPNLYQGDYVIFAEGNIRIRGTVGGRDPETGRTYIRHLTVVTNGTVYIDGSVLKDNLPDGDASKGKSSIALLAKDYAVVNTTQFSAPGDNTPEAEAPRADTKAIFLGAASPEFPFRFTQAPIDLFDASGKFLGTQAPAYSPNLFLRHSAKGTDGATAIRMVVNGLPFDFGAFGLANALPPQTTMALGAQSEEGVYFDHVFPISPTQLFPGNTAIYPTPTSAFGIDNLLAMVYDPSAGVPNQTDYRLSRLGIAPNDVRVEALIYAQEGSFFVIPGPWFNPDPNDTYERYTQRDPNAAVGATSRLTRSGENLVGDPLNTVQRRIHPLYPFHSEPQDIRVTFFGAITENLPAEIGDQGAWLEKWGWVPNYRGSLGLTGAPGYPSQVGASGERLTTVHGPNGILPGPKPMGSAGGSGLVYIYDDKMMMPYDNSGNPLRIDSYGRTLPITPRLPVAAGLIYAGETDTRN